MKKRATTGEATSAPKAVPLLIDAGNADTVYADVHLRRSRELLSSVLTLAQHNALKGIQREIDEALKQSRIATMSQDWRRVETLAGRVDDLRRNAQEKTALSALGTKVYDAYGVSIDPFSPGFDFLPGFGQDLAERRDSLVGTLKKLAAADPPLAAFYESRRAFFAGLVLASKRSTSTAARATVQDTAEIEQLAVQAAQKGDMSQLRRYAQELAARQAKGAAATQEKSDTQTAAAGRATLQSPVDLAAPFPDQVAQRAQALGLAVARTEPLPQSAPLFDYVTAHIWQPSFADVETEKEGAMRAEAVVDEVGFPPEVSGPVKVLVGQFLRNAFINSGGARYLPLFTAETALIEDFPEDQEAPNTELLSALGLQRRRGLARLEIDDALLEHGAEILQDRLRLDPQEFRLVCVPQDIYTRFGRDRGWGQQQQWTHFDGYQVLRSGQLRALVGGDVRYGGLNDLVSLGITDQRDSVIARFAVIRRARQVARWR
jgi:hypothetical protein